MKCLQENDSMGLMEIRQKVNFSVILKSSEPNFIALKKDIGLREIVKPVTAITESFLNSCYPDQSSMALDVSVSLIEREPTWTIPDVVNFYKTVLFRQDLEGFRVFGNKITTLRLMEMVATYEELKAEEREKLWAEEKGNLLKPTPRVNSDQSVKALMGKELERIQIRDDGIKPYLAPADEKFFNPEI